MAFRMLSIAANDNLINLTRRVWQPRCERDLSHEDARQVVENVVGVFSILGEWARVDPPTAANEPGKPAGSDAAAENRVPSPANTASIDDPRAAPLPPNVGSHFAQAERALKGSGRIGEQGPASA